MKMIIQIRRKENLSYPVVIEEKLLEKIPRIVEAAKWGRHVAIITDSHVKRRYGDSMIKAFKKANIPAEIFSVPPGENEKSLARVEKIAEVMVKKGFKRDALVIGLGGGVILDLAGFIASIYMRGVPHINIPTTLLAMVDASLGGKTGVDLKIGKNLLGTFHQPKAVYMDPDVLVSLSEEQFLNGLAEVIKHGVIGDRGLIRLLEKKHEQIKARDTKFLLKMLERSCQVKRSIVERDEREGGNRILLNYGHTVGHAVERASRYTLGHGLSVAIGMNLENQFFVRENLLAEKHAARLLALLNLYGLPSEMPKGMKHASLRSALLADKKIRGGRLHVALPKRMGKAKLHVLEHPEMILKKI